MNVSFVGCGEMAMRYLAVYRDLRWVRVVSCIGGRVESAGRAAAMFPEDRPLASSDFSVALAPEVDAVIVNTPNAFHADQAVAAIRAGKHVLIQKPLAATLEDAARIAEAAADSRKTIGLYMSYFDQPLVYELKSMAEQQRLGEIVHCYGRLMHTGGMTWSGEALAGRPTWRGSLAATGGGCFIQLGIHFTNLFEWLTGSRIVDVVARTARLQCRGIEGEDVGSAIFTLRSGALVTLDMAWCAAGEEWALHGTRGSAVYRNLRNLEISLNGGSVSSEIVPPAYGDASNPLNQHRVFIEAAREGRPASVSVATGLHDMRVIEGVYESARTGNKAIIG